MRPGLLLFPILLFAGLAMPASADYPMQAEQVAPGIYAVIPPTRELPNPHNRGWNSNSAFVVTADGVLLFDSGSSTTIGESLKQLIATITDQPVRWIVNSHAHGDHWLGNGAFADSVEKIFATETVNRTILADGKNWIELFNNMTDGATGDSQVLAPNSLVNQHTELELGGLPVVLFPSGDSHSPGDLILWLPVTRVLISGDVIYSDRMPSTNNAKVQQWISMLGELELLQPVSVIPGHGQVTDAAGISRLRELLEKLWAAVEAGYQAGKTDYEMLPQVTAALAAYRADYPGLDDKLKRDISHVYLQVEAASF
jgi:glyoxylase-like metal-dependent hydrolase (beta-lactamase superfamily II)